MSKEINHHCIICGKGYHTCDSCNNIKTFTPWRTLTDTTEHFLLYMVLQDYINKRITKAEAKKKLSNFDLSEKDTFKDSARNAINEILGSKATKVKVGTEITKITEDDNKETLFTKEVEENCE